MSGEKLCAFEAELPSSVETSVVDAMQPSGAVWPRHVSRNKTLLPAAVLPAADSAGCDANTTKRPSPLIDGEILAPPRTYPSGAFEMIFVDGLQTAGASIPEQVSARTISEVLGRLCTEGRAVHISKLTYRPLDDIVGRPACAPATRSSSS